MEKSLASKIVARHIDQSAAAQPAKMETVPFAEVPLSVGAPLQMRPATLQQADERYAVEFYGAIRGRSLMLSLPVRDGKGLWMQTGQAFAFHFLEGTHVYAFSSSVLRARSHPFPYVHFAYPAASQARRVRNAQRVRMNVAAQVGTEGAARSAAMLVDLSTTGCGVTAPLSLQAGDALTLHLPVSLLHMESELALPGLVRSRQEGAAGKPPYFGVQFGELATNDAMLLHHYIDHLLTQQSGR